MHSSLINFNVSDRLRSQFDAVCRASGRTRTSVLIELMADYVLSQGEALEARAEAMARIERVVREVWASDRVASPAEPVADDDWFDDDMPPGFCSNDAGQDEEENIRLAYEAILLGASTT